jgi:predicted ATP-binding protein involved in virulence
MISTERTGAVMFQNDLNLAKSRLLELLNRGQQQDTSAYALPVRDNIDFMNSLASIETQGSFTTIKHPELLEKFAEIVGGSYKLNNGILHFKPTHSHKTTELRMSESSSVVRALVILGYYLKHLAKKGDMLMIDEPELNLHPANQRKLARLLARLVNVGVKVFVTTHSDYFIKEFNTLIMLNNENSATQKIREKWHYDNEERLNPEKVRLYTLREEMVSAGRGKRKRAVCTVTPAKITPSLGIEVPTFDDTIDEMNAIQDELYYHSAGDE